MMGRGWEANIYIKNLRIFNYENPFRCGAAAPFTLLPIDVIKENPTKIILKKRVFCPHTNTIRS